LDTKEKLDGLPVVGYFDFGVQFLSCGELGCGREINQSRRCIARQQNLEAQSENLSEQWQAGWQASEAGPEHVRILCGEGGGKAHAATSTFCG
jgi:hypothetical protein